MHEFTFSSSAQPIRFQTKHQRLASDTFFSVPNWEKMGGTLTDAAPLAPTQSSDVRWGCGGYEFQDKLVDANVCGTPPYNCIILHSRTTTQEHNEINIFHYIVSPAQRRDLDGNNRTLESSAFEDEECLGNPHPAYLQLSGNQVPLQNLQDIPPLPPIFH
jgi:hypothetical protein